MRRRLYVVALIGFFSTGCTEIDNNSEERAGAFEEPTGNGNNVEGDQGEPSGEVDSPATVEPSLENIQTITHTADGAFEDRREIEVTIHNYVNAVRDAEGLGTLILQEDMRSVAQSHSRHMISEEYFGHRGPEGRSWKPNACDEDWAENLYRESGFEHEPHGIAQRAVGSWMDSDDHRRNVLVPEYTREGIGIAISSEDEIYVTQSLC